MHKAILIALALGATIAGVSSIKDIGSAGSVAYGNSNTESVVVAYIFQRHRWTGRTPRISLCSSSMIQLKRALDSTVSAGAASAVDTQCYNTPAEVTGDEMLLLYNISAQGDSAIVAANAQVPGGAMLNEEAVLSASADARWILRRLVITYQVPGSLIDITRDGPPKR